MIVRKYGRRGKDLTRSYSGTNSLADGVSDSPSPEFTQDVYSFALSSQDSTRCQWSDPYGFGSSQETRQVEIFPARKGGICGDYDGKFRKPKKANVIDVDSDAYGSSSSKELRDLKISSYRDGREDAVLGFCNVDYQNSKEGKKINSDPYVFNSSPELEELDVLPQRKEVENRMFEFSGGEFWESEKSRKFDSNSYGLNSYQESSEFQISLPRKFNGVLEFDGVARRPKKKAKAENISSTKKRNKLKVKELGSSDACLATTLMETQEFGEMMEHMDEVNFALDGLKREQQVTVRRASLLSLLSICGTQQRRLLRAHGMSKIIIDAVLGLNFDDPPSNLAAAAIFYFLTMDGQDRHVLDSPNCVCFLVKLLKPLTSSAAGENVPSIGNKLLGLCKNITFLQNSAKGTDSSSASIALKVQEMLINCKEITPKDDCDNGIEKPELSPKWISLLTMEKACLSAMSIEDSSVPARKIGVNFKEKLRELGGLYAVFEEARKCHLVIEEWLERSPTFALDSKDNLESLVLLLKCLRVMENATFLSKNNQCHLLGMKGHLDGQRAPHSFTMLILNFIKILSGVSLLRSSSRNSHDKELSGTPNLSNHSSCSMDWNTSEKAVNASQNDQFRISSQSDSLKSCMEPTQVSSDRFLIKMRVESSKAGSCSGLAVNVNIVSYKRSFDSKMDSGSGKRQLVCANFGDINETQDPFAFDEDEFEPSNWDLLSGRLIPSISQESTATKSGFNARNYSQEVLSQQKALDTENCRSQEADCSSRIDEEKSILLADCLLTSVKVLMNLTNDNAEGCQQIASSGGLEILSSLIAGHFAAYTLSSSYSDGLRESSLSSKSSPRIDHQNNPILSDQELDFLVAILGLLVNLVEKDGRNRARLAAISVSLPNLEGLTNINRSDVISLLCSIFLTNQGAGEANGEGKYLSWEDEDSILQEEKEAEKMIVEAYAALLLAFLSTESKSIRNSIAERLPKKNLTILVPVLERFVEFHLSLNMITPETHTAVLEVVESCRIH